MSSAASTRHFVLVAIYRAWATLKADARKGYFGVLWWIVEPVIYMLAFYALFVLLLQQRSEEFVVFLLCGLVPWKWFDSTVRACAVSIRSNKGMMSQIYVPKYVFGLGVVLNNAAKYLISLTILLLFLYVYGVEPRMTWLYLPVVILLQLLLILGLGFLAAALVPFAEEINGLLQSMLTVLFFMSGIFFSIRELPDESRFYAMLNPMATLIDSYRRLLIDGMPLDVNALLYVFAVSMVLLSVAVVLLRRFNKEYPKMLL